MSARCDAEPVNAAMLWAKSMLRRNWRATIFLAVFAGLGAGAVMTAFEVARRTSSVMDRRIHFLDVSTMTLEACSKDFDPNSQDTEQFFTACYNPPDSAAIRDRMAAVPGVTRVIRGRFSTVALRPAGSNTPPVFGPNFNSYEVDGDVWAVGRLHVVSGRMPHPDAPDEIAIDEIWAGQLGVKAGDRLDFHALTMDEYFAVAGGGGPPIETDRTATLVGVVRQTLSGNAQDQSGTAAFTSQAWFDAQPPGRMSFGPEYAVWWKGDGGQAGLTYALTAAFRCTEPAPCDSDRILNFSQGGPITQGRADNRAVGTQGGSVLVAALLALVAVALFVGQAVARQLVKDLADHRTMCAIGLPRGAATAAAVARIAPVAVAASVLGAGIAAIASPIGPVGLGRRAETAPGIRLDWFILLTGAACTFAVLVAVAAIVGLTIDRARRTAGRTAPMPPRLPPTAAVGWALFRSPGGRLAFRGSLAGAAVGIAAVVASFVLLSSLDHFHTEPTRFGQTFDFYVNGLAPGDGGDIAAAVTQAKATGVVTLASAVQQLGSRLPGDLEDEALLSYEPVIGAGVPFVVLEGRLPTADSVDEIALGTVTMRRLGLKVGDTLEGLGRSRGDDVGPVKVVGRVVVPITDNDETAMGRGGIVGAAMAADKLHLPGPDTLYVVTDPTIPADQARATLGQAFGASLRVPRLPADIANLDRISSTPKVVAGLVVALAAAALAHALMSAIRRRRRDIGVVQALGFTRSQVSAAVAWQATGVGLLAAAIGIAVGIVGGRWGWSLIERRLGVVSPTHIPGPVVAALAAVVGAPVFANLIALIPAVRAARTNIAVALRAD